ncbi:MAG: carbon storage regulator CsrA [Defluviitaleaceae bacterium]|nr:carbon storage regulator CsrA [Defluviitaleaceae bacterium]
MLALTRKKGQSIMIADDIEIVVISITQDQVKLGIRAPREIPVNRKEIYLAIAESNREAKEAAAAAASAANSSKPGLFQKLKDLL